tara:strand:+ start:246 stop:1184 length:939 start_codon:yes stop_codon:yes gene_type:complete
MNALLFPGQGSQSVGMGTEFYNNFNLVKNIFNQADDVLNFSISKMILEGPESELQLTKYTQPAILIVSYSIFKTMQDEFNVDLNKFKFFAGHSLGEYSALVSSSSVSFKDALYLLYERGKAMQDAVPLGKGKMIAILGKKIDEIKTLIELNNKNEVCEVANDNAEGQVIVSGSKYGIETLEENLKNNKIKFIPLKVSAPFHCSLMKPAAEIMREKLKNINFKKPIKNIISNVTAKPENEPENIKNLLIKQIYSSVNWRESIINISNEKVNNFVEIGPGKVLSGMVKRTIKKANCFSINSIADIENFKNEFKE